MTVELKIKLAELFDNFEWRAVRLEDADSIHQLLLTRDLVDQIQGAGTLAGIRKELEDNWLIDREQDSVVAIAPSGEVAAFGLVFADPQPEEEHRSAIWLEIHPAYRLPGMHHALGKWAVNQAKSRLEQIGSDLPRKIEVSVQEPQIDWVQAYRDLGFEEMRNFYHMRRDLRLPVEPPSFPAEFSVDTYREKDQWPLWEAFNESFADHWNFHPVSKDDWQMWFVGGEDFRPDLTYIVSHGQEIAAFSINGVNPERNQQRGINEGWIHQLGTRRAWRKRGLASGLLNLTMQAFQKEGLEFATLGVDTHNLTGALYLYERLGFQPVKRFILYRFIPET
jgi:ribosomal protein S18 acetylase RimI-like enzyme